MKIFISYSSHDKWVAGRIARDLQERGIEIFLAEKSISAGDSIPQSITDNLRSCDEVLLLLTPTSAASQWVLIELGGALALGKRVVPVLYHVQSGSVPQAICNTLSRDINEIEHYYDELTERQQAPPCGEKSTRRMH